MPYQTLNIKPKHPNKVVICGLFASTSPDFIVDLKKKGFKPITVTNRKHRIINQALLLSLVTLENIPNFEDIAKIHHLYVKIDNFCGKKLQTVLLLLTI